MQSSPEAHNTPTPTTIIVPSSRIIQVGGRLSYADVRLFDLFEDFFDDKASAAAAIAPCPRLTASVAAVKAAAAAWLAERPQTPM